MRKPQIFWPGFLWPNGGRMNRVPLYQITDENHTIIRNNNNDNDNDNDDKIPLIILGSIYRT